jgi:membrane fusion protein (multidrug efflux system)
MKADAPAADLVRLREGTAAKIELDALPQTPLAGTVVLVSPAVDPSTSLGGVRVLIAPPTDKSVQLKLGLAGSIAIAVAQRASAITVPAAAVRRSTDGAEEVVACDKDAKTGELTAAVVPVKVGARAGDRVEIVDGLVAGRSIVVRHVVGLDDGTPLEVEGDKPDKQDKPDKGEKK